MVDRWQQWVNVAHGLIHVEPMMVVFVQGLGRFDCICIDEDERRFLLPEEDKKHDVELLRFNEHFTISHMWVLGAYEVVRTISQRFREDKNLVGDDVRGQVEQVKHRMERLRVPLAKYEAARRHPGDRQVAWPSMHMGDGIAWEVAPNTVISRRALGDELLNLITLVHEHRGGSREYPPTHG